MIIVENWFGRLGNNIISLLNILDIALFHKHNIVFKIKHTFFNLNIIENYFNKYKNNIIVKDQHCFYYKNDITLNEEDNKKKITLLKQSFIIKDKDIPKLSENDVVVHIRSGDIFSYNPHPNYAPPPLSYYVKQLDKFNYKKIIIVCEDKINPVVNKLLELYKNSIYHKNSLATDIKLILGATNVISSVGTFVSSLLTLSNNIKYHYGEIFNNPELKDYYLITKPWKNTVQQRNYMLTYKM